MAQVIKYAIISYKQLFNDTESIDNVMCGPSVNCVTQDYNLPPLTFIMQPIVTYGELT